MPTLNWIGKDKVANHHREVPFRTLERKYTFGDNTTDNKIIHGDNLEALKALLPEYEGRIKCIYIDPPYNTGNEGWVYNDNVNDPKIQKWLGQVVGKEADDLTRHDKWLCMMYPRLALLKELLSDDGAIFISIDDNEQANLKLICDEIFGAGNFVANMTRIAKSGGGHDSKHLAIEYDYILFYAKNLSTFQTNKMLVDTENDKKYKYKDDSFKRRGKYYLRDLDYRGNYSIGLDYPIVLENGKELYAGGKFGKPNTWRWSKEKFEWGKKNGFIVIDNQKEKVYIKQYQFVDNEDNIRERFIPYRALSTHLNSEGSNDITNIFKQKIFDFPKPLSLLDTILQIATDKSSIILDSFAGSGTTAHAVLNLNKADGGNRKFILVEMEDYAETITAERVRRVISGYGSSNNAVEGTGGGFAYYELGEPVFAGDNLNENIGVQKLCEYIWYSETRTPYKNTRKNSYLLGYHDNTDYYFYYEPDRITTLSHDTLNIVERTAEAYVIYADRCTIDKEWLNNHHIVFKKIPRDIRRF